MSFEYLRSPQHQARLAAICRDLLVCLGFEPQGADLADTPARWARMWAEFLAPPDDNRETAFETHGVDQLVVVSGIPVWSLCAHHLLPYECRITIGYLPRGKLLGLSKFARAARSEAAYLTMQETLVDQIAEEIAELTDSPDVAVLGQGRHLCMAMRGVRSPALLSNSTLRGAFRSDATLRSEFLALALQGGTPRRD